MDNNAVNFFVGFTLSIGFVVVLIELVVMCFIGLFSRKERNMSFKKQIEAGAKLLDKKIGPAWIEIIDLDRLDLSDSCNCVVGQACPDKGYVESLIDLFGEDSEEDGEDHLFNKSDSHGFATENYAEYPDLTLEWKAYIQERRTHVPAN